MHPVRVKYVPELGSTCVCVCQEVRWEAFLAIPNNQEMANSQPKYALCFRRDFSLGFVPLEIWAETFLHGHNYPRSPLIGLVEPLLVPLPASKSGDHARSW